MRTMDGVHPIRLPFQISVAPGFTLDRSVYLYLVLGKAVTLVDGGVAGCGERVFAAVREAGRRPEEIDRIVLTHSHPDHVGGVAGIRNATGCRIAAHSEEVPWIEDVERQSRERPVPGFHALVEGSVPVDRVLADGDVVDLGGGRALTAIHTPGHSRGHLCYLLAPAGALFAGDAIPVPGSPPIYDDAAAVARSLRRLMALPEVSVLFPAWSEPVRGARVRELMSDGMGYLAEVHRRVVERRNASPAASSAELASQVLRDLGLGEIPVTPLLVRSIASHVAAGPDLG